MKESKQLIILFLAHMQNQNEVKQFNQYKLDIDAEHCTACIPFTA